MDNWKEIVKQVAPTLGVALDGAMAGAAMRFIAEKLLDQPDATTPDIKQFIEKASSSQLATLKSIDAQFKQEMAKLNIDIYTLETSSKSIKKEAFEVNIWAQIVLSSVFVIGYFCVLFFLIKHPDSLSSSNAHLMGVLTTIFGVLTASIPQILHFWLGSSLGTSKTAKSVSS